MSKSIALSQEFEVEHCCSCGVAYAMPAEFVRVMRETHRNFYCPNGHAQQYTAETQAEKARRELAQEQARHQATQQLLDQARRDEQRLKKRIAAGVCPCCNRTFQNLGRHMGQKHPTYKELPAGAVKQIQ